MFVDYADLKSKASMEAICSWLNLGLKPNGAQLRGPCPICKGPSDRCFVVTPAKSLFKCFANGCEAWGDQIELVAKVKGVPTRDAAIEIARHFGVKQDAPPKEDSADKLAGVVKYLVPDHESVLALGLTADTCRELGAGYKPKGVLAGTLAIPIHDADGRLVAYVGRAVKRGQDMLTFVRDFDPAHHLYGLDQIVEGELHLAGDPLKAMIARQHGMACVAVLGAASQATLALLLDWMKARHVARIELI